jgi:hypothetical protein
MWRSKSASSRITCSQKRRCQSPFARAVRENDRKKENAALYLGTTVTRHGRVTLSSCYRARAWARRMGRRAIIATAWPPLPTLRTAGRQPRVDMGVRVVDAKPTHETPTEAGRTINGVFRPAYVASHSGRIGPPTPSKALSSNSATNSRVGSTGPGIRACPFGIALNPTFP